MNDELVMTVADLMEEYGFGSANNFPENSFLREIKAESQVGKEADRAIQNGSIFGKTLQPHPDIRYRLGQAIVEHIRILYYG